jgi:hypothetical protein
LTAALEVGGGGAPTAEEVAAIAAALEVVLGRPSTSAPAVSPWRWSGRRWQDRADWRRSHATTHPSAV